MKTKLKLRIIWEATITRIIIAVTLVVLLLLAIILPSMLTSRPKGSVLAFNRDASSGTREAFVKKVLDVDDDLWTPGSNVREVRNNDAMITFVQREKNSVGYVSFGTVAEFDEAGNPLLRDRPGAENISFTTFNGVIPTYDNIMTGEYEAARNFNLFFRVVEGSAEAEILNYDWTNFALDQSSMNEVNSTENANDLKVAYLFYSWIMGSQEAYDIVNESGELPYSYIEDATAGLDVDLDDNTFTERTPWFNDTWAESTIDKYVKSMDIETGILIEIVGSTSATAVMTDLTETFDEVVSTAYGLSEKDLEFVLVTNGSGDAMKTSIPGADHPFIGMQSKDQSADGFEGWGNYAFEDGTYNDKVYSSFAKDAILMIYNTDGVKGIEPATLDITRDTAVMLYTDKDVAEENEFLDDTSNYPEYFYYNTLFSNYEEVMKGVALNA